MLFPIFLQLFALFYHFSFGIFLSSSWPAPFFLGFLDQSDGSQTSEHLGLPGGVVTIHIAEPLLQSLEANRFGVGFKYLHF